MKYEESFPIINQRFDKGVYFLIDENNVVVYVGMSNFNILSRISAHSQDDSKDFSKFAFFEMNDATEKEIFEKEADFILKYSPKFNYNLPNDSGWHQLKGYKNHKQNIINTGCKTAIFMGTLYYKSNDNTRKVQSIYELRKYSDFVNQQIIRFYDDKIVIPKFIDQLDFCLVAKRLYNLIYRWTEYSNIFPRKTKIIAAWCQCSRQKAVTLLNTLVQNNLIIEITEIEKIENRQSTYETEVVVAYKINFEALNELYFE